eukprot:5545403-Pleurochrysis_carterae.AAC.2
MSDLKRTRQTYRPPTRPKGSVRCCPCGPGGENIACVPPNLLGGCGLPQLANGEERVTEGRYAAHVSQDQALDVSARVNRIVWHVIHYGGTLRFAIHS